MVRRKHRAIRKSPAEGPLNLREEFRQIAWDINMIGFSDRAPPEIDRPAIVMTYGGGITFNPHLESAFRVIAVFGKKVSIVFDERTNQLILIFKKKNIRDKWLELFKKIKDKPNKFLGAINNEHEFLRIMRDYSII